MPHRKSEIGEITGVRQVILDETQDTTKIQLNLLIELIATSTQELKTEPILMALGDERQQIFISQTRDSSYPYLTRFFPQAVKKHLNIQYRYGPTSM